MIGGGITTNLIYDPLGSLYQTDQGTTGTTTRFVIGIIDSNGNNSQINTYDEYGINGIANSTTERFGYTGQAFIPELGLYYYKARIYSPTLGRFLQTDPIGYDGGINLYAYTGDDPVNGHDPSGEVPVGATIDVVGKRICAALLCQILRGPAIEGFFLGARAVVSAPVIGLQVLLTAAPLGSDDICRGCVFKDDLPDDLVGEQDAEAGEQGNRHNSGPLRPDKGGTGDPTKDFGKLTGGRSRPAGPQDRMPAGSRIGENGIRFRPGPKPRIDIPANGSKPHETLHYP